MGQYFGRGTAETVRKLKETIFADEGLPITSSLDLATVLAITGRLDQLENKLGKAVGPFFIAGCVSYIREPGESSSNSDPASGLVVNLLYSEIWAQEELVSATTDENGYFILRYDLDDVEASCPPLAIEIKHGDTTIYKTPSADTIFELDGLAVREISVERPVPKVDLYTRIQNMMKTYLAHNRSSGRADFPDDPHKALIRLRQDSKHKEVSFLLQSTSSDIAATDICSAIVAERLADSAESAGGNPTPELFFAVIVRKLYEDVTLEKPDMDIRPTGLDSNIKLLLGRIISLNEETLQACVDRAAHLNLIPSHLKGKGSSMMIAELSKLHEKAIKVPNFLPPTSVNEDVDNFWGIVKYLVDSGKAIELVKIFEEEKIMGQIYTERGWAQKVISQVLDTASESFPSAKTQLTILSEGEKKASRMSSIASKLREDLANFERDGAPSGIGLLRRTATPLTEIKKASPLGELEMLSISARQRRDCRLTKDEAQKILGFLDRHLEFDLLTDNLDAFLSAKKKGGENNDFSQEEKELMSPLKRVQRVAKLTSNHDLVYEQTSALLEAGADSASAIESLGKTRLANIVGGNKVFTAKDIETISAKAANTSLAANLLAAEMRSLLAAQAIPGISPSITESVIARASSQMPNLQSLFNIGDVCACADCMTVYSPAAYLVDVLRFLRERQAVTDTGSLISVGHLIEMLRPDIWYLDLNCNNTNVTMPKIDLVCEVLEYLVGHQLDDHLSISWNDGEFGLSMTRDIILSRLETVLGVTWNDEKTVTFNSDQYMVARRGTEAFIFHQPDQSVAMAVAYRSKQTFGTSAERAAFPLHVSKPVYSVLANEKSFPCLPFHHENFEGRQYFIKAGISRAALVRLLSPLSQSTTVDPAFILEDFGLSKAEFDIISEPDNDIAQYWGISDPSSLRNVKVFLDRSELSYTQLVSLLRCVSWVNAKDAEGQRVLILHLDDTCSLDQKELEGLSSIVLDRIHRFLRLWRNIGPGTTTDRPPWTMSAIDRAIGLSSVGGGILDDVCLNEISIMRKIQDVLHSSFGRSISCNNLLDWFGPLVLQEPEKEDETNIVTYTEVFLQNLPDETIPSGFPESHESVTAAGVLLSEYASYLSSSIRMKVEDISSLLNLMEERQEGPIETTYENVCSLYSLSSITRSLNLEVSDFVTAVHLLRLDPSTGPTTGLKFVEAYAEIVKSGFTVHQLSYLLQHNSKELEKRAQHLSDQELQLRLAQFQQSNEAAVLELPIVDAGTNIQQKGNIALSLLRDNVNLGDSEMDVAAAVFAGAINDEFEKIMKSNTVTDSLGQIHSDAILAAINERFTQTEDDGQASLDNSLDTFLDKIIATLLTNSVDSARKTNLLQFIEEEFDLSEDHTLAVLRHVPSMAVLLREITSDEQVLGLKALRKLHKIATTVSTLKISAINLDWILQFSGKLGWASLADLPDHADSTHIMYGPWSRLIQATKLLESPEFAPTVNLSDLEKPFSLQGLFELLLSISEGDPVEDVFEYLSKLSGWASAQDIRLVAVRLGLQNGHLQDPAMIHQLDSIFSIIRRLNIGVLDALEVVSTVDLDEKQVGVLREGLKLRFSQDQWLRTLKSLNDPLRLRKRDALLCYLLPRYPAIGGASGLSSMLSIDVEVGTEIQTSRIISAHLSLQTLVQRLQMGVFHYYGESRFSLDKDVMWSQWEWMKQYRLWEANRKVFLYPENWLEPNFRDDKTRQFTKLEESLQEEELDTEKVEAATQIYVADLEMLAQPEVLSVFYEVDRHVTHVFSRMGAGEGQIYHRELHKEAFWMPWEAADIPGMDAGRTFISFVRNGVLSVAWLDSQEELDPAHQDGVSMPDVGDEPKKSKKRYAIYLNMSQRNPKTGAWSQPRISADPVYWPPSGNYISKWKSFDLNAVVLNYWNVGSGPGEAITLRMPHKVPEEGQWYLAEFAISGARGRLEAHRDAYYNTPKWFLPKPTVRETELKNQIFTTRQDLSTNPADNTKLVLDTYGTFSPHNLSGSLQLLGRTHGKFAVVPSFQLSSLDLIVWLDQFRKRTSGFTVSESAAEQWHLPMGTMIPFFYRDHSNRPYLAVPSFLDYAGSDGGEELPRRTATHAYKFVTKALQLAKEYIYLHENSKAKDVNTLQSEVENDYRYQQLLSEWSNVWGYRFPSGNPDTCAFQITPFYHPFLGEIKETMERHGLDSIFSRDTQLKATNFSFKDTFLPFSEKRIPPPRPTETVSFDTIDAYSDYNWELFFHLPFMIASKLNSDQRFEEAMSWFHRIFNPRGVAFDSSEVPEAAPQRKYWVTKPFFNTTISEYTEQLINHILLSSGQSPDGSGLEDHIDKSIREWRTNPFSPFAIARLRPVAFQIATFLKYIKNLVDWGDSLFRQLSRESLAQASILYASAKELLGPKPQIVEPVLRPRDACFAELSADLGLFGNAIVELENTIPVFDNVSVPRPNASGAPTAQMPLYFGVPANDMMLEYWNLVDDRLFKIRNSLDINGNFVSLPLTSPPIDPGVLIKALASGLSLQSVLSSLSAPLPKYRFTYMLEVAASFTDHVVSLGSNLLSLMQARDAEELAQKSNSLQEPILLAIKDAKIKAVEAAQGEIDSISRAKTAMQFQIDHYKNLEEGGLNAHEKAAASIYGAALGVDANRLSLLYSVESLKLKAALTPKATVGGQGISSPSALTKVPDVSKTKVDSLTASAAVDDSTSSIMRAKATMVADHGAFARRKEGWRFESNIVSKQKIKLEKDEEIAKLRLEAAQSELAAHERVVDENSHKTEFLQNKHTSKELYDWGVQRISKLYFESYNLALQMARQAERSFSYELATNDDIVGTFIKPGSWDSLRSGLLAGSQIKHDLHRMKAAYLEKNVREYEMAKDVSLRTLDPTALLELRTRGSCFFVVPEELFDMDTPGHYFRRNKVVTLSLPIDDGSIIPVSAKLTLTSHRYRASTATAGPSGYKEISGGDDRFRYNVGSQTIQAVVTSNNMDDGGFFRGLSEARRHGDAEARYLPFERTGVIGTYMIELPEIRSFDYGTIRDAILHLAYTAREGGSSLRSAVAKEQVAALNSMVLDAQRQGLVTIFEAAPEMVSLLSTGNERNLLVPMTVLPYFIRGGAFKITGVTWVLETKDDLTPPPTLHFNFSSTVGNISVVMVQKEDSFYYMGAMPPLTDPEDLSGGFVIGNEFHIRVEGLNEEVGIRRLEAIINFEMVAV